MGTVPLSVVILAKNEEAVIAESLESVSGWADEIIVVDDESHDRTVEIASRYATVLKRKTDNEGRQRNWAYSRARNDWVLSLDADEKVTDELKQELAIAIKAGEHACFAIPLRNYIGTHWVRYGGWYPASKVRLFRKDKFKYEEAEVHPRIFVDGSCGQLRSDIVHKGYPDIEHFLNSLNRQTTLEAKKWIRTNRKMSLGHITWRAFDRFFRKYIRKKAYKEGFIGFTIAFFDFLYQVISYVKFREMLSENEKRNR